MIQVGKKPVILLFCFTGCFFTYWYISEPYDTEMVYTGFDPITGSSRQMEGDGNKTCKFLDFDPFIPEAMQYYKAFPTTKCVGLPTITYYNGVEVKVNQTRKKEKFGSKKIDCWYRSVGYQRRVDFVSGEWQGPFQESIKATYRPDFVEVKCEDEKGKQVSRMHHYVTRTEERKKETPPKHKTTFKKKQMNVLLLGMDSLSSHLFKRAMPKTRKFLLNTLNATEMHKYNKVGDNTFPNLLAITAGVYTHDLKNWTRMEGFDKVPFLWYDYKAAGYRTQYLSDRVDFDDFQKVPMDSYNMPMLRALMKNKIAFDNNCFEDKIEVKLWLDLFLEFARESLFSTGRFFTIGMIKRPTHDFPNQASAVDEHYLNFFKEVYATGLLENTFVMFFGDHGPRVGAYRRTFHGSIEERAANMVIYVPPWFRKEHPEYYNNLLTNADMLTSNFDMHKTALSLITFPDITSTPKNYRVHKNKYGDDRAMNIFLPISPQRTCDHASISPHMCMCNGAVMLAPKHDSVKQDIGTQVVKDINAILGPKSSLCATLQLESVTSVAFLSGKKIGFSGLYRIMLTTKPGGAMFEATVHYTVRLYVFTSTKTLGLISRINMYRGQSDCVEEDKVSRMYCYCKDVLRKQKLEMVTER